MARGRKTTSRTARSRLGGKEAEAAQNASIEKQIAEIQRRRAEQALNIQIEKVTTEITIGDVTYGKANVLSPFTAKEFITALNAEGTKDMSDDLGADVTHDTLIKRMLINCEKDEPDICIYMRNPATAARFAMLQSNVEKTFKFPVQPNLQGWILHYGKMFIFGGVHHTLHDSVNKVMHFFELALTDTLEKEVLAEVVVEHVLAAVTEDLLEMSVKGDVQEVLADVTEGLFAMSMKSDMVDEIDTCYAATGMTPSNAVEARLQE